jgi:Uncharacterized protein conserved in bacteria (DUF2130)
MSEQLITCPSCGTEIELSEALAASLHAELEAAHQVQLAQMQAQLRRETEALVSRAEKKAREESVVERKILERELADERESRAAAQEAELELRKDKSALEKRARELDLEVSRRIDAEKRQLEEALRRDFGEQHDLKLKEKEKLIDDLRRALEEAKRKSEQGSQERQGEVLEIDVQAELERRFPGCPGRSHTCPDGEGIKTRCLGGPTRPPSRSLSAAQIRPNSAPNENPAALRISDGVPDVSISRLAGIQAPKLSYTLTRFPLRLAPLAPSSQFEGSKIQDQPLFFAVAGGDGSNG